MKEKTFKTTEKDFKVFKETAENYVSFFSLGDFCFWFEHIDNLEKPSEAIAWFSLDPEARVVNLSLSKTWPIPVTELAVEKAAFHEVVHVLLGIVHCMATEGKSAETAIDSEIHAIIRRLENSVFEVFNEAG